MKGTGWTKEAKHCGLVRGTLLAFLLAWAFLALPGKALAEGQGLTVMIYLCGSDLETRGGFASEDIQEMIEALQKGEEEGLVLKKTLPLRNMATSDTLADFLKTARELCPAERYGLICWDHGEDRWWASAGMRSSRRKRRKY